MKTLIHLFLTFLFLIQIVSAQEQHQYSHKEVAYYNYIKKTTNNDDPYRWGETEGHRCGAYEYNYNIRNFNFWEWSYAQIPKEASVTSVTIKFRAYKNFKNHTFSFKLYDIPNPRSSSGINYYNECTSNREIYSSPVYSSDPNYTIYFDQTFTSQSPSGGGLEVWNAVSNAVQSGVNFFTIGIQENSPSLYNHWWIAGYDGGFSSDPSVDLIINYTTPDNYYSFINKIGTREDYGSLILNDDIDNPILSGADPIFLSWGSPNSVRTDVLPFSVNWDNTGTTQKQNYWDLSDDDDNFSLHYDFDAVTNSSHTLKATFEPTENSTLKNNAPELGDIHIGNFSLTDPWHYYQGGGDQWRQKLDPTTYYNPLIIQNNSTSSYGGVFLNQGHPNWDPPYYSVKVDQYQDIPISQTGRTHRFYLKNWTGINTNFQYPNNNETGVVFTNENSTVQANLKGTQLSNTSTAYNTAGQRKYIRTTTGILYNAYESLGDVYLEKSTDSGGTWSILNNGQPINVFWHAQQGSSATIAISYDDYIYVAYQSSCDVSGLNTTSVIVAHIYQDNIFWQNNIYMSPLNSTSDLQPVMTAYNGGVLVVINPPNQQVLHPLFAKKINVNSNHTPGTNSSYNLPYTDSNSNNASIVWDGIRFHLAYESQNYQIKYIAWRTNDVPTTSNSIYSVVSDGSGYYNNQNPSISLTRYSYPIISWVGKYYGTMNKAVLRRGVINNTNNTVAWDAFYNVGSNVSYVHSNSSLKTDEEQTVLVWNEGSTNTITKWVKKLGVSPTYTYSSPASLSPAGSHTQITTGSTIAFMRAMVFNNSALPYYFTKSSTEVNSTIPDGGLNKITDEDTIITFGRSGVASINDIEFVFNIGDVLISNNIIEFINVPDTISYLTANDLNQSTRTNNFELNSSSELIFSNIYYVVQKSNPDTALTATDAVNFKVELVNALTSQVVGTFDNITYDKNNLEKYASIDYSVDCSGIAQGEYYLRLVTSVNVDALYTLSNIVNDNTILAKKNFNNINFTGTEIPIAYDLAQNFPNPFNPSTTIRFQIPQDGIVTLKIYDILGSEVATLVNEEKVAGKYEVNFNASSLASGVYIYKIQAGSFINSKKMILLK